MPRKAAPNAGLTGPSRTFAPASVREAGRQLALTDTITLYEEVTIREGGAGRTEDQLMGEVQGRIDPIGDAVGGTLVADQIDERSTHVVSVPAGTDLTTRHKVATTTTNGVRWAVLALHKATDGVLLRAEVRVA